MSDEISIRRFTWLLDQRRFSYLGENQLQQAITIRGDKRPDFLIDTGRGVRFVCT